MIYAGNNPYREKLHVFGDKVKGGDADRRTMASEDWRAILKQGNAVLHDLPKEFLGTHTKSVLLSHELLDENMLAVLANGDDMFAISKEEDEKIVMTPMDVTQQEKILPKFFRENYKQLSTQERRGLIIDPTKHEGSYSISETMAGTLNIVRNKFRAPVEEFTM